MAARRAEVADADSELAAAISPVRRSAHASQPRSRRSREILSARSACSMAWLRKRRGWVCGYLTPYLWGLGEYGRALETGRIALDTAVAERDTALEVIANRYLGHVHYAVGDYSQAVQQLQTSLNSLEDEVIRQHFHLPYKSSIATGAWLASSLAELGRFTEAIDFARRGVAEAEVAGHAYSVTETCLLSGRRLEHR